ncbi:MAG: ADP-glyceromanno-heptose 6-epimerase [Planctomycetes bacterium RBG_16_43_13]|nr:MAG: ADP-glyceromanno-heptose 6-epimerase [Planctomycetes bacterium RBG_16_43_13]
MIIVTGGAGFIGSAFIWKLNTAGIDDIIVVDEIDHSEKRRNITNLKFRDYIDKDKFLQQIENQKLPYKVDTVIHMGACTSTTEQNAAYLMQNNYLYTRTLAEWTIQNNVHLIYASSAATYGDGSYGYSDDYETTLKLQPLNMYGHSKHLFDLWALRTKTINKIVGIKFFNVFGPNEYHKGAMASVVFKAYQQINNTGKVRLFKSYKDNYKDGEQCRDFIYVKDCVEVMWWLMQNKKVTGLFNLGTGKARRWNDLANAVFSAMDIKPSIEYIEMPETIRGSYQYFTEAKMEKLRSVGCNTEFHTLEGAVMDYITSYLKKQNPYLQSLDK